MFHVLFFVIQLKRTYRTKKQFDGRWYNIYKKKKNKSNYLCTLCTCYSEYVDSFRNGQCTVIVWKLFKLITEVKD